MIDRKIKILIGILAVVILVAGGWRILKNYQPVEEVLEGKHCEQDSDCIYGWPDKCIVACVNKNTPKKIPCPLIKPAIWSSYIWNNMPCKCIENQCVEDKKAFCQKSCEDWVNSNCTDGIPKSAFFATKCEDKIKCGCLEEDQATITTDKTEYEQGEEVKFTVKNNLNQKIVLIAYDLMIEKLEENEWKMIRRWGVCCGRCEPIYSYEVYADDIKKFTWDQKTFACEIFGEIPEQMSAGKYRVKGKYFIDEEQENIETIYSNEFTIK